MKIRVEPEGRLRILRRWGIESGGLGALSVFSVAFILLVLSSVLAWWPGFRIDPSPFTAVYCALELTLLRGLATVFVIGYVADLFSGHDHGLWWTSIVVSYVLLRLLVVRVVGAQPGVVAILTGLTALMASMTRWGLLVLSNQVVGAQSVWGALMSTVFAVIFGYPLYRLFRGCADRFRAKNDTLFH